MKLLSFRKKPPTTIEQRVALLKECKTLHQQLQVRYELLGAPDCVTREQENAQNCQSAIRGLTSFAITNRVKQYKDREL